MRNSVLEELRVRRLADIQEEMSCGVAGDAIVRQYGQLFQQQLGFLYLNGQSIVVGFLNHWEFSKVVQSSCSYLYDLLMQILYCANFLFIQFF